MHPGTVKCRARGIQGTNREREWGWQGCGAWVQKGKCYNVCVCGLGRGGGQSSRVWGDIVPELDERGGGGWWKEGQGAAKCLVN